MHKTDVRELARKLALPAAERPESQEICFVPNDDYRAFLKDHAPGLLRPGELIMTDGKVVGRHEGIALFTVGQRRKLGVAAGERLYVVRIEQETNKVVLGKLAELQTQEMVVSEPTWTGANKLTAPLEATVKIRYRSPFVPALITPGENNTLRVTLQQPVPGVCPGQSAVFYDNELVLGGGIIEEMPHAKHM